MESRQQNFAIGHSPTESLGLLASAARFNAGSPRSFRPNGLNQPVLPSGNGMSAADATRITPNGMLPSMNGSSAQTYNAVNPKAYGIDLNI